MVNKNRDQSMKIIKSVTNRFLPNSRILLFGSQARQDFAADSDYDVMIITKYSLDVRKKREYQSQLRKILAKHKIPADILIESEEEFNTKKEIIGHIVREAVKEGIKL